MTLQTPIYGIEYPDATDLVRDIPTHMRDMADTIETALHQVDARATPAGSTPVIATTWAKLSTMSGVIGQTGYVTNDTSGNSGPYIHNGTGWTRGSVTLGDDVFDFREVTNWRTEYRAWLSAGTVHLSLHLNRKVYMGATALLNTEPVGKILIDIFKPTCPMHLPAFTSKTTTNNPSEFGIQMQSDGTVLIEALQNNAGINAGGVVQAMLTWPCAFN